MRQRQSDSFFLQTLALPLSLCRALGPHAHPNFFWSLSLVSQGHGGSPSMKLLGVASARDLLQLQALRSLQATLIIIYKTNCELEDAVDACFSTMSTHICNVPPNQQAPTPSPSVCI